jgi:hypothetical protein
MNYLKLTDIANNTALPDLEKIDSIGQYLTYEKNILQKKNNELALRENIYGVEYRFNNFGYSDDGKLFAFIYKNETLVLLNNSSKTPVCVFPLPMEIKESIKEYINFETRGFLGKLFSHLSFLKINHRTNNIYIHSKKYIIVSSCKQIIIIYSG